MKRVLCFCATLLICVFSASAQKKVSILGDSYSTFKGFIPEHYNVWYPLPNSCDVSEVNQTWWQLFINSGDYVLEKNDSWSGSTICNTGYNSTNNGDSSDRAFISRVHFLGNPDIIFVFGGTNDVWAHSPMGEYQYSDWTRKDLYNVRPALAYLFNELNMLYPQAEIYFLQNTELTEEFYETCSVICEKYGVSLIVLKDIEKQTGHPSIAGMKAICDQINSFIKK